MACGPLPKLPQGSDKTGKTMPERLAKRKHQITHLAQVVSFYSYISRGAN